MISEATMKATKEAKKLASKEAKEAKKLANKEAKEAKKLADKKEIEDYMAYIEGKDPDVKVLEPCNPSELNLDISQLKKNIGEYLSPNRIKYYQSTNTVNLVLEDGYMEYLTALAIGGKRVGAGHCAVDIVGDGIGIDVLCVCLTGNESNEKSLTQNFKESKAELEEFFKENKPEDAIKLYKKIWFTKLNEAKKNNNLTQIYYVGFISTKKCVYMSVFKINVDAILNIKNLGFTKQLKSINFENVIDEKYGKTKLYESKKRMEIRFNKNILECDNTIEIYNLDDIDELPEDLEQQKTIQKLEKKGEESNRTR